MTRVLLVSVVKISLGLLLPVGFAFWVLFDRAVGFAVYFAGALLLLNGFGLVYVVGQMLEPGASPRRQGLLAMLFLGKFALVAALLWFALQRWQLPGLGLGIGLVVGLLGLVLGLHRGSTSAPGLAAMAHAELQISQEIQDSQTESS